MEEIKALSDVWNLRPEFFNQGMDALANVRQQDTLKLQQQTLANTLAQQNIADSKQRFEQQGQLFPLQLQREQNAVQRITEPEYTIDQFPKVLEAAATMSRMPGMNTPAAHAQLKKHLRNFWYPGLDSVPPDQLPQALEGMLKFYNENNAATQRKLLETEIKGQTQREVERMRAASREKLAQLRAQVQRATNEAKKTNDPRSFEALAARLMAQAMATEDDALREYLSGQADLATQQAVAIRQAAGQATKPNQPDMSEYGVPTTKPQPRPPISVAPPPTAGAASPPPRNNPAAVSPATAPGVADRQIRQAVTDAGYPYEPDKYEYRVGPNGEVQRRKKQ